MKGIWTGPILFCVAVFLLSAGYLLSTLIERPTPEEDDWYVEVSCPGRNTTRMDLRALQVVGVVDVSMALLGTGEDGKVHSYRGIYVKDLILSLNVTDYTRATAVAADAYSRSFPRSEIEEGGALLAWERDGKALEPRSEGGAGPVRLIVPQETVGTYNAQYCVKWVSGLVVE